MNGKQRPSLNVFGAKKENSILVPNMPLAVRNNCQSGKWTMGGDKEYGSKLSMTILKFSKFFGSLGQTQNTIWGQIWFVAEAGDLPKNVAMVTYIKGQSLQEFNTLVALIQARGIEPAEGIFVPTFAKRTGQKTGKDGVPRAVNYYVLEWDWTEREENQWEIVEQAAAALLDHADLLVDVDGTRQMICLDNLPQHEVAMIINSLQGREKTKANLPRLADPEEEEF
ncbi:MAG: hypothetical protein F6J93_27685 [Oscillatoria sp. SIO1A7]|nr:hypothetical protein [Oscillatoria sp. SIO1A7]